MTPQQLTGASSPIKFSGREYQIRTLTEKDHQELNNFVQQMIMELAKRLSSASGPTDRNDIYQAALDKALGATWDSDEGEKIWHSHPANMARIAWQSCNKPEKSYEEFCKVFIEKEHRQQNVLNFLEQFYPLNFEKIKKEGEPDGETKS